MAKFRKKPVVIEAVQWKGHNIEAVRAFMYPEPVYLNEHFQRSELIGILTPEGMMVASKGDHIIRGVNGELYLCKPDIFAKTYEAVEE